MKSNQQRRTLIEHVVKEVRNAPWKQTRRRKPTGVLAVGWPERLHFYCWASKSKPDLPNHLVWLHQITTKALRAEASEKVEVRYSARCQVASDILEWGGVKRGNLGKVPMVIDAVINAAKTGSPCPNSPMNSGWTKIAAVYSMISSVASPQVIWDSRVSLSVCTRLGDAARTRGMTAAGLQMEFGGRLGWVAGRGGTRACLMASAKAWFPNRYGKWDAHFEGGSIVEEMAKILNADLSFYGKPDQALSGQECTQLKKLGIQPSEQWNPWLVACVLFMDGQ